MEKWRTGWFAALLLLCLTGCSEGRSEIRKWKSTLAALAVSVPPAPDEASQASPTDPAADSADPPDAGTPLGAAARAALKKIAKKRATCPCSGMTLADWQAAFGSEASGSEELAVVEPGHISDAGGYVWDMNLLGLRRWLLQPNTAAFVTDSKGHVQLIGASPCELARAYATHKDKGHMGLYQPQVALKGIPVDAACRLGERVTARVDVILAVSRQTLQAIVAAKGPGNAPSLRDYHGFDRDYVNHFGQAFLAHAWTAAAARPLEMSCQWARNQGALPQSKLCLAARHMVETLSTVPQTPSLRSLGVRGVESAPVRLTELQFRPAGRSAQTMKFDVSACFAAASPALARR